MSSIKIDRQILSKAVEAGVLQAGQDTALLTFLHEQRSQQPSFQASHVAFYFGAVLIMLAMGWFLTEAWMNVGDTALLLLSICYFIGLSCAGYQLWQRGLPIPGGLLGAVAVSLTPLIVFALQRTAGWWPDTVQHDYEHYYRYIEASWLPMELATVVVGLLMLRLLPFPFIVMPIALALWFLSMDLSALLYREELIFEQRLEVSLWFGLALLVVSLAFDNRFNGDYAFWGYLAGLLAFWGALSSMDSGSELGKALYCAINLILMIVAILLRRPLFMVFGALGVAGYLGYLAMRFDDSLLFPIFLSAIGLGLIFLGIAYQRHRQALTHKLRSWLPKSLIDRLPALQR